VREIPKLNTLPVFEKQPGKETRLIDDACLRIEKERWRSRDSDDEDKEGDYRWPK